MAISKVNPVVAGSVKLVQRGVATVAGNITITSVNLSKTVVYSFSTGSAGTVAATGNINSTGSNIVSTGGNSSVQNANGAWFSASISGGTTNLTSAQYGAYLTDATTLTVTGPCRWQVVEHF